MDLCGYSGIVAQKIKERPNSLESDRVTGTAVAEADVERADRVARRLHAELRGLIAHLAPEDRGASAMSRALGVERTTCQRVGSAVAGAYPGCKLLGALPGVRGLSQFVEGMRDAGVEASAADSAEAAVESFQRLIRDLGGSQTRLVKRLASVGVVQSKNETIESEEGESAVRRRLFESGRQLCGQHSEVSLATFVFRPTPGREDRIDMAQLRGFLGHRMSPQAMPFSVQWWVAPEEAAREPMDERYHTLDRDPIQGRSQGVLLEEFSSSPLPTITSRGPSDQRVVLIDPSSNGDPFDVVTANLVEGAQTHPAHDSPPMHEVWVLGRFPAKVLLFDVLLHRSMARACIPGVGRYVISPSLNESMDRRWLDRFPGGPRLQLVDAGLERAENPCYPRYEELLAHLFGRLGWSASEFVGYRCEVEYPQWGAGYCMSFDYAREGDDA